MIKYTKYIITGLLACLSNLCYAEDSNNSGENTGLSKQFLSCMDKSGGVTSNMVTCIVAENKKQNHRLNKAYKKALATLTIDNKTHLTNVQKTWLKYRDENCNFYANLTGGTMDIVNSNECIMSTNANRAMELEGINPQ
jgi:uncharacterized protein YecT (DUF1311 family)